MPLQEHPRGAALRCGVGVKPLGVELTSRYFFLKVRNLPKAPITTTECTVGDPQRKD
jgi:hypothetical protein